MVALKIIFADNVFAKLKEEAEKRNISATNCAYRLIREVLQVEKEED